MSAIGSEGVAAPAAESIPAAGSVVGGSGETFGSNGNHGPNNIGFAMAGSQNAPAAATPGSGPAVNMPPSNPQFGQQNVPQTLPQPTPQDFARMFGEAFKMYQQQNAPAPQAQAPKYRDPKHWALPQGDNVDGPAEFAQRFDSAVQEATAQAIGPLQQEIAMLRDSLVLMNGSKAVDPGFQAVQGRVMQILESGATRDVGLARHIAELERRVASSGQPQPTGFQQQNFPHPVPTPPPHAQSPTTRAPGPSVPQFDPKARPNIMGIVEGLMRKEGFIQ